MDHTARSMSIENGTPHALPSQSLKRIAEHRQLVVSHSDVCQYAKQISVRRT